jgi:hypothetical protein
VDIPYGTDTISFNFGYKQARVMQRELMSKRTPKVKDKKTPTKPCR